MSCGCSGAGCTCNVTGGQDVTVTGTGSKSNPFVVSTNGGTTALDTADTSTLVWTQTGSGTTEDPYVLKANASSPITAPVSQVFTANDTWTKPPGVGTVRVYISGGGGGGAGGGVQSTALAANLFSAKGGGGGNYLWRDFPAADVPASVAVTVGNAGVGGAGATTIGAGANGTAGGASSFGALLSAAGGAAGTTVTNVVDIAPGANGGGMTGLAPGGGGYGGSPLYGSPTTTVRTNLVTNPSFENNVADFAAYDNCTIARVAVADAAWGSYVLRATGNVVERAMAVRQSVRMPVTVGTTYAFQSSLRRNSHAHWTGAKTVTATVWGYNAAATLVNQFNLPTKNLDTAGIWYRMSGNYTVPAGVTSALVLWTIDTGGTADGTYVELDKVLFTVGTGYQEYFDGGFPDTPLEDYAWTGTAGNSTSTVTVIGGPITFSGGGVGGSVPAPNLPGGTAGPGGGIALTSTAAGLGGGGSTGSEIATVTNRPGGSGGGGGGAGRNSGPGGFGVSGSGGAGGGTGLSPVQGARGGDGGKGFVTVIAW